MTELKYKVRGPDPDGDYFIVEFKGGQEQFLDETFLSEEAALIAIASLTAGGDGGVASIR